MKAFVSSSIMALMFLFFSCAGSKTNKQLFDENLDKYIESCVPPFIEKGVDSTSARNLCRCVLEKAYTIDSSVFLENYYKEHQAYIEKIFNERSTEIFEECGPLIKQYLPSEGNK